MVDGTPWWLSQRMRTVESRLASDDRMVLSISPAVTAERWKSCKGVADARLWTLGYEVIFQRVLLGPDMGTWQIGMMAPFVARTASGGPSGPQTTGDQQAPMFWETNPEMAAQQSRPRQGSSDDRQETMPSAPLRMGRLMHLRGHFLGQPSATSAYQMARLSDRQLADLNNLESSQQVATLRLAKQYATYWLGLLAYEQRNYASARDYLLARTLEVAPRSPWTPGAKYNLGRVYEAEKEYAKAIQQYRGNTDAIDAYGNRLRARWLETLAKPADLAKPPAAGSGKSKDQMGETPDLPGLPDLPGPSDGVMPKKKAETPAKKPEAKPAQSSLPAPPGKREKPPEKKVEPPPAKK
jgi:hypothetical protein